MNTEFSRQIFEKLSDIKFHENPAGGSRAVPQGRSARHDEFNSRHSQFCEGARWVTAKKRFEVVIELLLEVQSALLEMCHNHCRVTKFPLSGHSWEGWLWNSLRNVGKHAHGNSATSQKCRHFLMMRFMSCWRCGISLGAEEPLVKWTADSE